MDHWGNQEDIKSIANDAIHSMDEDVQDILEQDDGMQMSSFAKLCREYVRAAWFVGTVLQIWQLWPWTLQPKWKDGQVHCPVTTVLSSGGSKHG